MEMNKSFPFFYIKTIRNMNKNEYFSFEVLYLS